MPGIVPVPTLPVDADTGSAAFYNALKSHADFLAYLQAVAKYRPGLASGSVIGFTSVTHTGTGSGTVTLPAISGTQTQNTAGPRSVVIKVSTGGAQGTAQAQWSNDGGNTYQAAFSIPNGNYTDATSGITVTFGSFPFALNDLYTFQPTDTPLAQFPGGDGMLRFSLDHMGFPSGRIVVIDENWDVAWSIGSSVARAQITQRPQWNATTSANATIARTDASLSPFYSYVKLVPGTANTNSCQLDSERQFSGGFVGLAAKLEFEFAPSAIGATNITWQLGLGNNGSTLSRAIFQLSPANTNWQCITTDGGAGQTQTDSNTPPVAGAMQRFRVELYESGTPFARLARYFINDLLVAQHVPANDFGITGQYFNGACAGAASAFGQLGPTRLCYGRFLVAPVL